MIDYNKIAPIIDGYKKYFPEHWTDEKYKWEVVKHFQNNWDINAENFGEMFKKATEKTSNLLVSGRNFPKKMILEFAKVDDSTVHKMFINLFDESIDLAERVEAFIKSSEEIREKYYDNGDWKNHYQDINAISTYLWLRYPDKYYIYKYELYKAVAEALDDTYRPKHNGSALNIVNGFKMYDEISSILQSDEEIRQMLDNFKTDTCYSDPELKTATIDFGFYLARFYVKDNAWFPSLTEYDPGLSVEDWKDLLKDREIFNENSLSVIRRFYDIGGDATCKELSKEYGEDTQYYNSTATRLAERIVKSTNCPIYNDNTPDYRYWPVLFVGKRAKHGDEGVFRWKLRNELKEAIKELFYNDNTGSPEETAASNAEFLKYFAPLIQALKELGGSATRKEAHEKVIELMDISEDELSVTYEKSGASRVLNQIDFTRNDLAHEGFISSGTKGVWALTELGMNVDMTLELAGLIHMKWVKINTAKRKNEPIPEIDLSKYYKKKIDRKYTKEDFLKKVFMTEAEYNKLRSLVLRKKNIILQGAPGVGKTFSAKRLAYSIIGEKNENRICMVQFHQNYSYEDFIMGYRPNDSGGFELQSGVFYNFCIRCKENPDKPYFFIIDEINRGNLSKIFGELLMLIETDKRGEENKINLVYGGEFYIPQNLHIIGMMNTADRSLAMIDYALRRRFSFYTITPAFDNADNNGFNEYVKDIDCELYHTVMAKIKELNKAIRKDSSLGKGFEIGHSYFALEDKSVIDDEWVHNVVEFEIIPLLEEYWFDNDDKSDEWKKALYLALGEEYDG